MSESADAPDLSDRLADFFLYAPLGLLWERDQVLERLVKRGRSQTQLAKLAAQMAVQREPEEVEKQVRKSLESLAGSIAGPIARVLVEAGVAFGVPGSQRPCQPEPPASPTAARAETGPTEVGGLADYDRLSARELIGLLDALAPAALIEIRSHESAGRKRKTVLAKLDQLLDTA
ncbi:MAG: hypothetical protein O3C27_10665 [Actinomycetota bacterium]|nr:hypothetical protein [Actinomycetota bacterium]